MALGNFGSTKQTVTGLKDGDSVVLWNGKVLHDIKRDFPRATSGTGENEDGERQGFAYCQIMKKEE